MAGRVCKKCGREGHAAGGCWFLTDASGRTLDGAASGAGRAAEGKRVRREVENVGRRDSTRHHEDHESAFKLVRHLMDRDEWLALCRKVEDIIRGHDEAYIGRSCDPARRLDDHAEGWDAEQMHRVSRGHVDRKSVV